MLFLLPLVVGFVALEVRLAHVPNIYTKKKKDLDARADSVQVLILGASHAFFDVNPDYLSRPAFNLASTYQSAFYDVRLTEMYLNKLTRLKLVILSADFTTFFLQLHQTKEEWRDYYYYQFWHIRYPGLPLLDARKWSKVALYTPEKVLKDIGSGFQLDLTYTQQSNGWAPYRTEQPYVVNDSSGRQLIARSMPNYSDKNFRDIAGYYDELLHRLHERNIQVAFVTFPADKSYYNNLPQNIVAREDSLVQTFCQTYGCSYYNYLRDARFTTSDFADNDHIFPEAATRFSKILDSDVVRQLK